MELLKFSIPASFINQRVHLTWSDVLYGIEHELMDPRVGIELAADRLGDDDDAPALVELASLDDLTATRPLIERLSLTEEPQKPGASEEKWLYLVLAWVFENRAAFDDPLGVVEDVYADFRYPERIAALVRYMPSDEADLGPEGNNQRIFEKWRRYLNEMSEAFTDKRAASE